MKNIKGFLYENAQFLVIKFSVYLNRRVFVMGKFRQIFIELSAQDTPIFSFSDDNLNK